MTETEVFAKLRQILPQGMVFRYGLEMQVDLKINCGMHRYVRTPADIEASGNRGHNTAAQAPLIVWATVSVRIKDGPRVDSVDHIAVCGKGQTWDEAMGAFEADLKKKLVRK